MDEPSQQAALQRYLLDGERLLWTGQPDPRRLFSAGDLFLIPFSLMWGGFALFWEATAIGFSSNASGGPIVFFLLWGIPFVVAGQYFIWGRFIYKRWDRKRTIYAVTTRRVLVLRGSRLQTIFVKQLPHMNQTVRADGSGSIEFGSSMMGFGFWANTGMDFLTPGRGGVIALYDIPNVDAVARAITAAATQPKEFPD